MSERSLLAAVCADPADDLPRLATADWLEDAGRPERAEFIRCQVGAERLHPDANRRAVLEARAEALFAEHWVDWWGEVCAAVGLPLPEKPRPTRLGRLAQRRGWTGLAAGLPYRRDRFDMTPAEMIRPGVGELLRAGFVRVGFRRGFPDVLESDAWGDAFLVAWPAVAPIREFRPLRGDAHHWGRTDGPHLAGVRRLVLSHYEFAGDGLAAVLASPHLAGLTDLRYEGTDLLFTTVPVLVDIAASAVGPRLSRLEVPLPDDGSAIVLAGAERLTGLTALRVELEPEPAIGRATGPFPAGGDVARLEALARSPHLAGLTDLHVCGVLSPAGVWAVVRDPAWAGLRSLHLQHLWGNAFLNGLADANLADLIDLKLTGALSPAEVRMLARAPLLGRLRHLNFWPRADATDADILSVADALDPGRLETLSLAYGQPSAGCRAELVRRFGDRVRITPVS